MEETDNLDSRIDPYSDDEDEFDLIKLVSTNANDTSQYLIFVGSDNQYYAKNVSKIEELLVYKDIRIARSHGNPLILGTADIRGNMTTIVNFDQWFGNEVLDDSEYELIILTNYGGHRMGIVVKSVEHIVNIPSATMSGNSDNDDKTSFITKISISGKNELCIVFDSDKLLLDVFDKIDAKRIEDTKELCAHATSQKTVVFADDSKFIRKMAEDLFKKMQIKYYIYENGQLLYDALKQFSADDIGLFITDLEMPVLGGKDLIDKIRAIHDYDDVKIIVHTNMSNTVMASTLLKSGANAIIGKVNMLKLGEAINDLMR